MRIPMLIAAAALMTGAAIAAPSSEQRLAAAQSQLDKALAGRVAGKPVDCIQLHSIQSSEIIDGTAILYKVGRTTYVNRPRVGAESLRWDPVLLTDTHSSQLCSIDTVQLLDRTSFFYRGFVGLGEFVPYTKAE